jgi:cardiolipin-specific phospholipase
MPDPNDSTLQNEFTQSQDETTGASKPNGAATNKPPRRQLPKWVSTLWDANISPFSIVRLYGPLGPRLVSGWTSRRFSHLPPEEAQALHDYSYSLFRQRGSGEYALAYILAPGAFARSPLIRRIQGVGRQYLTAHAQPSPDGAASDSQKSSPPRETGIPVVFLYGDTDWMDKDGGYASTDKIDAEKTKALAGASERERQLENGNAKTKIIRNAGHHVYLDGWEEFNRIMADEMRDVEKREKRLATLQ